MDWLQIIAVVAVIVFLHWKINTDIEKERKDNVECSKRESEGTENNIRD